MSGTVEQLKAGKCTALSLDPILAFSSKRMGTLQEPQQLWVLPHLVHCIR